VDILTLGSYEEFCPYWEELNRSYRSGELCFDWRAYRIIWEGFYAPRGVELRVYVALEERRPLELTTTRIERRVCLEDNDEELR
jgi:hypothetical protein